MVQNIRQQYHHNECGSQPFQTLSLKNDKYERDSIKPVN